MIANSGETAAELRFLFLSPASRQALMGMRALARSSGGTPVRLVGELAREAGLPANATAKIFQRLSKRGLLISQRGPGGGYALAKPAGRTTLGEILRAVQDIVPGGRHCLLRHRFCGEKEFCPIHRVIAKADRVALAGFERLTLRQLAASEGW